MEILKFHLDQDMVYLRNGTDDHLTNQSGRYHSKIHQNYPIVFLVNPKTTPHHLHPNQQEQTKVFETCLKLLFGGQSGLNEGIDAHEDDHACIKVHDSNTQVNSQCLAGYCWERADETFGNVKESSQRNLPHFLAKDSREDVNEHTGQLAFCNSKLAYLRVQNSCVILCPVCSPEGNLACNEDEKNFLFLKFDCLANGQHEERDREGVTTMVEQLSQWGACFRSPCLFAVDRIQSHVGPDTKSSKEKGRGRNILLESVVISEHVGIGQDNQNPSYEGDKVGGDPHGNQVDAPFPVVVHFSVEPSVTSWFVLVVEQLFQSFFCDITHQLIIFFQLFPFRYV